MKIFKNEESSYPSKINFVDNTGSFVGYDMEQSCCEFAGYILQYSNTCHIDYAAYDSFTNNINMNDLYLYNFDITNVKEKQPEGTEENFVIFKLCTKDKPDIYLHIFNVHNGYYAHILNTNFGGQKEYLV